MINTPKKPQFTFQYDLPFDIDIELLVNEIRPVFQASIVVKGSTTQIRLQPILSASFSDRDIALVFFYCRIQDLLAPTSACLHILHDDPVSFRFYDVFDALLSVASEHDDTFLVIDYY